MQAADLREREHAPSSDPGVDQPKLDWRLLVTVVATAIASSAVIEWLTPAPVRADHHLDALSIVVNGAFYGFAFAGVCMLMQRRATIGYAFIAGAAWSQLIGVMACPISGHHDYGAWWAGQMAVCLAFAVVSTMAAFISSRAAVPARR
jgi:hypothetical protein